MRLISIPEEQYEEYRLQLMFDCYKWDPQFLDSNTIAKHALSITEEEYQELVNLTEALDQETKAAEEYLNAHQELTKPLRLSRKLKKEIAKMDAYDPSLHIRLKRYDFPPTEDGTWAVSEVNSDVPGGFAEASVMPEAVKEILSLQDHRSIHFGNCLLHAVKEKLPKGGRIALVHCTSYSDDRQVMQFLGDMFVKAGYSVVYMAADHLHFKNQKAYSILDGNEGEVDAIIRFTPLEWMEDMKSKAWHGYFDTTTVSCNHPVAIYAQTKCFPFVWEVLESSGVSMSTWKQLHPDTMSISSYKKLSEEEKANYIFKPVYGRVGENIGIKEACSKQEYAQITKEVTLYPNRYIAQKRFHSKLLLGEDGKQYHVCLGSYTINGKHAGFYARISNTLRIDSAAADIPVLIEKERR